MMAIFATLLWLSCASEEYPHLYAVRDKAPSLDWSDIEAMDHMGATLIDGGTNFAVYSEHAERMELLLFEDPESDLPTRQVPLHREGANRCAGRPVGGDLGAVAHYVVAERMNVRDIVGREGARGSAPDRRAG